MEPSTVARDRLTEVEAKARAGQITNISYALDLDLEAGAKVFRGDLVVVFDHSGGDTFMEWVGGTIDRFEINGAVHEPAWNGTRIALPARVLQEHNEISISWERKYDKTGEGFHQFIDHEDGSEYLYTQFEPYSAHRLFPCFDQPDLKAVYRVSVTAPSDWAVVTAGPELHRDELPDGRSRRVFAETVPFSTYLLAVCAGPFASVHDEHNGIPLGIYVRSSWLQYLDADAIFSITKSGMDYFSDLFDEPYPFGKFDQLFVPEFNWGGMENVATVTYTDSVIFRDPPTEDQLTRRAEYLLHELAHMWFGDLVTMRWWSDLWLNESFASFAAYLALDAHGGFPTIWQDFNYRMKLWAYTEDQLPTTHKIADEVPSTDETFLNFDGITYGKGASVLKQLVATIGMEAFRTGMQAYFRRHRFGNASLADFLAALQEGSGIDLVHWASRWLMTPSLNTVGAEWDSDGTKITEFRLRQTAPEAYPTLRPHHLEVVLLDGDGGARALPASFEDPVHRVAEAVGTAAPVFVYPNFGDHAFAKVALDPVSIAWAKANLSDIGDPLLRQQVWVSLWEMVRDQGFSSLDYLELIRTRLPEEQSLNIVQMVTATAGAAIGRYVPAPLIDGEAAAFVAAARQAVDTAAGDLKVIWARSLVGMAAGPDEYAIAAALVDGPPEGVTVDQEMRWSVAVAGVAAGAADAEQRLASERTRDQSDRGARAMVRAEAARPDPDLKAEVWDRIHNHGYDSLHLALAAAGGFWRRQQAEMVEPFVPRFFEGLPGLFAEWEPEAARGYFNSFFPHYRIESSTRDLIAGLRERADLGPILERMLIEQDDVIQRALACRAFAAPPPPPPSEPEAGPPPAATDEEAAAGPA
ncbi:MAG: aminopeptidase N [Acidimicrobiia bacterium]|nr:aminopeptidase N [Acidimicrobiia bacterium]